MELSKVVYIRFLYEVRVYLCKVDWPLEEASIWEGYDYALGSKVR